MVATSRLAALLLVLPFHPATATAATSMVERFDAAVARLPPEDAPADDGPARARRSAADVVIERRLNIEVDFPGDVHGAMYGGFLHGEAAVFTRSGHHLDATVMRDGDTRVMSFDEPGDGGAQADPVSAGTGAEAMRVRRSVRPGHFEDPAAYSLHFYFFKHDDLADSNVRVLHARYVAWWMADMATHVLPVNRFRASYAERVRWLTSMPYGDAHSLDVFERTLKAMDHTYGFDMDRTYKRKFVLLTAGRPMPGTSGVAFEGGNEAIASIAGRTRIVAHEIGHMLGATHLNAETRGWWGCETNMLSISSTVRSDCLEYSAANQRAMRSYMRHGPDTLAPRKMVDAPTPK
jgi:hypothetical protein